jgi:RND family efflux transporter MFP subunit
MHTGMRLTWLICLTFGTNLAALGAQLAVTGVVRAEGEVVVHSEFAGIVQHIAVREGDQVQQGQVLVELRNERQQITVDLAGSGLDRAQALAEETTIVLANAERELERLKIAGAALPRKELEDIEDQVLRLGASLSAQMAELGQAEAELRLRQQELRDTQLLAPFTGTVTEIYINQGESLRPMDTPVAEIVALEDLYVELLLPSSYVQNVRPDQRIPVRIEAEWMGTRGHLSGTVIYVNPTVDAASRTFGVKVGIPNAGGLVRPGMLAEAQFGGSP